jgi:hypothetical protein
MGLPESRQKLSGIFSRRRFQALAAAGILSVGLGVGAVSGVFAAPSTQSFMAAVTPVATSGTPGATNPGGGPGHPPGGIGRFGRGPGGPGMMGGQFFGPVATFLGISTSDLQTALNSGQTLTDVAVAHGKTAASLKAFLVTQDSARIDKLISSKFPARPMVGPAGARGGMFGANVATFLGISQADFQAALKSGQTPAQIAVAHSKTAADLKTYLTAQLKTKLDQAVTAGRLTSQQETDQLTKSSTMIDKFINSTGPQRGHKPGAPSATATATTG